MKTLGVLSVLAITWLLAAAANGTWSIVAVDPETREVGVAGASCTGGVDVIGGLVPGRGAVAAQAWANLEARDLAKLRIAAGASAAEVLAEITDPDWDPARWYAPVGGFSSRQYSVVVLGPSRVPATFTGADTSDWAGARVGDRVAVAGNLLVGPAVVEQASAAFEAASEGCSPRLAERLLSALEAGARAGGDRRCVPELAALSAFLEVAGPTDESGESALRLVVPLEDESENRMLVQAWRLWVPKKGGRGDNPVLALRDRYLEAAAGAACLFDPDSESYRPVR